MYTLIFAIFFATGDPVGLQFGSDPLALAACKEIGPAVARALVDAVPSSTEVRWSCVRAA